MNEDDVLLRGFMGNKYTKFMDKKFSGPAFFFGGLYYIYRKMYKIGFIFYAITTFLNILLSNLTSNYFLILITHLIVSVVYAAEFGPLYRKFANNQIAKIKKEHANESDKVLDICQSKGGTNFGFVVLAIIAGGICTNLFEPNSNNSTIITNNNSSIVINQNYTNVE